MNTLKFLFLFVLALFLVSEGGVAQTVSKHDADLARKYFGEEMKYKLNYAEIQRLYLNQQRVENRITIRDFGGRDAYKYVNMRSYFIIGEDTLTDYLHYQSYNYGRYVTIPQNIEKDRITFIQNIKNFRKEAEVLPSFYATIDKVFGGDVEAYANYLYDRSIVSSLHNFDCFQYSLSSRQIREDPFVLFTISLRTYLAQEKKESE